jgi:3',5'-cyclic AMP phosphodiesterase CpdA
MRIAHISDLHALDLSGASPLRFLSKRFFGWLNLLRKRRAAHPIELLDALCADLASQQLDHVVVTGDLTNLSLPSEFQRARRALDGLPFGPLAITAIPGNHDVYVWEAYFGRTFEKMLLPYAQSDGAKEGELPTWPIVRVRDGVAIVGCSTALPSPVPLADGWLGGRQLKRLEEILDGLRDQFRVLLIHHPLLPQHLDVLRALRDRGRLHKLLQRVGCELVLHGHEHRDLRATVPGPTGPIPVIGVGSGTYNHPLLDRRARYNVYTVTGKGRAAQFTVEQRVHDPASGIFVPYQPAT